MGEGERAEARRQAGTRAMIAGSAVVAALIIVVAALFAQGHGRISAPGGIAIALLYAGALVAIAWRTGRKADEVEIGDNLAALAAAGALIWLAYPAWYFLWLGGLLPEPRHELLYVATVVVTTVAYVARKIAR